MKCDLVDGSCRNCGGKGAECLAEATLDELREMEAGLIPRRAIRLTGVQVAAIANRPLLTPEEIAELLPGDDPTLIGNRLAELTRRLGVPPCSGCADRQAWLNRAHQWLRQTFQTGTPAG